MNYTESSGSDLVSTLRSNLGTPNEIQSLEVNTSQLMSKHADEIMEVYYKYSIRTPDTQLKPSLFSQALPVLPVDVSKK